MRIKSGYYGSCLNFLKKVNSLNESNNNHENTKNSQRLQSFINFRYSFVFIVASPCAPCGKKVKV